MCLYGRVAAVLQSINARQLGGKRCGGTALSLEWKASVHATVYAVDVKTLADIWKILQVQEDITVLDIGYRESCGALTQIVQHLLSSSMTVVP